MYEKDDENESKLILAQKVYQKIKKLSGIMIDLFSKNINSEVLNNLIVGIIN
jgi:hypothetical protein